MSTQVHKAFKLTSVLIFLYIFNWMFNGITHWASTLVVMCEQFEERWNEIVIVFCPYMHLLPEYVLLIFLGG